MALINKLTAIADAIRAKTGGQALLSLTDMVTEIGTLKNPSGSLSISENDTYDVSNFAEAVVDVQSGITPTGTLSITRNGTFDVTQYAQANVNVSTGDVVSKDKFIALISRATTSGNIDFSRSDTAGVQIIRERAFSITYPMTFTATFADVYTLDKEAFKASNVKEVTFDKSVAVGDSAFYGCTKLTTFNNPAGIYYSISSSAFSGCTALTALPNLTGATQIDSAAFYNCSSITEATIPNTVTSAYSQWFAGCSNLETLDVGTGVTRINSNQYSQAFYNCTKLKRIILRSTSAVVLANAYLFSTQIGVPSSMTNFEGFYVPDDLVDTYKAATNWTNYSQYIKPISDLPTS